MWQRAWGEGLGRVWRALLIVILFVGFGGGDQVAAVRAAPAPPAAAPLVSAAPRVASQAAKPEFPDRITFTLTAESGAAEITDARLFYRPTASEVANLSIAPVTRGRRIELTHIVDMKARYLPPGLEIEYYWSLIDAAGNRTDTAPQTFLYQDGRFSWRTVAGGRVTIYYYSGNDDFGRDLLDTTQRTITKLGQRFGVTGDKPIQIVVYGNNRDFSASLPPNSAEWIGGQAHPDLGLIVTGIQPGGGAAAEIRRILPHEVSHLLLYQATENPYGGPAHWLDEGLAVYNQETADTSLKPLLDRAVATGTLLPARALNSNFPLDPTQARLSYAESHSLVGYLIGTYGDAKLGELLRSFGDELSYDEALRRVYGFDTDGLDREWKASLNYGGDKPVANGNSGGIGSFTDPFGGRTEALLGVALPIIGFSVIVAVGLALRRRRPAL
ncbi:MAG: hypothetical protein AVDCRST_MAG18-114 [uncultured Thermomicrobiales bacterium]|uniref:Peptidase MA-like domain-containing protein n=1 Tax=uncultured Thermomicrobiales bacterium TaxID=1645740 RepID=A0A6J4UEP9_9BACT|nr:MAG: hypothetical protein AVDCRST_MAG18-114 [uncultured Thermomicrobiales bacterium]